MASIGKSSRPACAICGSAVAPRAENRGYPFCSERCQTIDLGHWLDERYRIPTAERGEDDSGDEQN